MKGLYVCRGYVYDFGVRFVDYMYNYILDTHYAPI